jgi:hypothetical protein
MPFLVPIARPAPTMMSATISPSHIPFPFHQIIPTSLRLPERHGAKCGCRAM